MNDARNTTSPARKQTLKQAVKLALAGDLPVMRCGLAGCPVGGWAETQQAMTRIADELPRERGYKLEDLIDALYTVDSAGRYEVRS